MKMFNKIKNNISIIVEYIALEFKSIAENSSVIRILIGGVLMYGLLYNFMYAPNLVRKVPVIVVDESNSPLSREYLSLLDASEEIKVHAQVPDMQSAKELMKEKDAVGIVYLPKDFEEKTGRGEQSVFLAFANTRAFLFYSSVAQGTAGAMLELDDRVRAETVALLPLDALYGMSQAQTINVVGTALFNYTEGYGSYLMPGVFFLIIFQTLMMVIGMLSGEERHSKSILRYSKYGLSFSKMGNIIIGKAFVYCGIYSIFAYFLIGLLPQLFSIPDIGNKFDVMILLIPYMMATAFFGLTLSFFFTDSDSPILMIVFFSVGYLFLSGISYPLELMPWYWQALHYVFPSSTGVLAMVKVNSMGADISQIKPQYITLWVQCFVYFITASLVYRHNIKKAMK